MPREPHDCEIKECLELATRYIDGHFFCDDHTEKYTRDKAQKWCEERGLKTPEQQKKWFKENANKAFKRL